MSRVHHPRLHHPPRLQVHVERSQPRIKSKRRTPLGGQKKNSRHEKEEEQKEKDACDWPKYMNGDGEKEELTKKLAEETSKAKKAQARARHAENLLLWGRRQPLTFMERLIADLSKRSRVRSYLENSRQKKVHVIL